MRAPLLLLTLVPALAAVYAGPARAETSESSLACSLPEPDATSAPRVEDGIDLGDIVSQELSSTGSFTTTVEPTVQLDFDWGDRIVNLTPGPASRSLVFRDSRNGYQVLDYGRLEGGIGAQVSFHFGNSTFLAPALFATVGLIPLKGGSYEATRYYADRRAVENRADVPDLNDALKAFERMRNHDALSYDTYGGLTFWGGVGYGWVGGVTVAGLAKGEFQVNLEKMDADHVYVKITDSDLKSLGIQAGNLLVDASVAEFSRRAGSLGFAINVHDKTGMAAFHDLVNGNAAPVQRMAAEGKSDAVRFFDDYNSHRVGTTSRFWIGLPVFLGMSWSKTNYYEVLRHRFYSCGRSLSATYGAFFHRYEGHAFGVTQQMTKAFYGTSYALASAKGNKAVARGYFGELVWTYHGTRTKPDTFRRAMSRLAEETGLGDQLVLDVPASVQDRLDFTSLTLRAQFSAKHVLHMVQHASEAGRNRISDFAHGLAQSYFASVTNTSALCDALKKSEGDTAPTGSACVSEVMSRTDSAVDNMVASLRDMSSSLRKGDEKRATRAFARFGEAMLTNQFTLKTALQLAGADMPVDYVVEGSDFYRYSSMAKTVGGTGRLTPDNRSPLFQPKLGRGLRGTDSVQVTPLL